MNFENIIKQDGRYFSKTSRKPARVGDLVVATGWFDRYENGQRRLCSVQQVVTETRHVKIGTGYVIKIDGPTGSFECHESDYVVYEPITDADVARCQAIVDESESLLAARKRTSMGPNRGKPINTGFQQEAAINSLSEQRRMLSEMIAQRTLL